ncbi:hypothetical protein CDD83_1904 [Cordyceps sp. RAO-2017]|nr:hypothetical protein CDD83_1904 [Cordyceps sp. RAO-2017]
MLPPQKNAGLPALCKAVARGGRRHGEERLVGLACLASTVMFRAATPRTIKLARLVQSASDRTGRALLGPTGGGCATTSVWLRGAVLRYLDRRLHQTWVWRRVPGTRRHKRCSAEVADASAGSGAFRPRFGRADESCALLPPKSLPVTAPPLLPFSAVPPSARI